MNLRAIPYNKTNPTHQNYLTQELKNYTDEEWRLELLLIYAGLGMSAGCLTALLGASSITMYAGTGAALVSGTLYGFTRPHLEKFKAKTGELLKIYQWCVSKGCAATNDALVVRIARALAPFLFDHHDILSFHDYDQTINPEILEIIACPPLSVIAIPANRQEILRRYNQYAAGMEARYSTFGNILGAALDSQYANSLGSAITHDAESYLETLIQESNLERNKKLSKKTKEVTDKYNSFGYGFYHQFVSLRRDFMGGYPMPEPELDLQAELATVARAPVVVEYKKPAVDVKKQAALESIKLPQGITDRLLAKCIDFLDQESKLLQKKYPKNPAEITFLKDTISACMDSLMNLKECPFREMRHIALERIFQDLHNESYQLRKVLQHDGTLNSSLFGKNKTAFNRLEDLFRKEIPGFKGFALVNAEMKMSGPGCH